MEIPKTVATMLKINFFSGLFILVVSGVIFESANGQVLTDSLFLSSKGVVIGGEFDSLGGWSAINWNDLIKYDLKKYYSKGRFEIDIRKFDPLNQNSEARHHILAMYCDSLGNHNHWSYNIGDSTEKSVWNVHTGLYYKDGFKFLSTAGEKIESYAENFTWNIDSTYHFAITWNQNVVQFLIDSVLIFENTHLQNFALRYAFVGRDYTRSLDINTGLPNNEYPPLVGPIYSNLVIYGDSLVPELLPNEPLDLPINLPQNGDIYSFDVDIKYDSSLLTFESIQRNPNEPSLNLNYNSQPELLKIGAYNVQPIQQRNEIITIRFATKPDSNNVRFAQLRRMRFLVNADSYPQICFTYVIHPLDSLQTVPVELSFFEAILQNKETVLLRWHTESEKNNYGFEIQRATGNTGFQKIAFLHGNGTSSGSHEYEFVDRNLLPGIYTYRLKQIDYDGSISYSEVKQIQIAPEEFMLQPNYPNPFSERTQIPFVLPATLKHSSIRFDIYDVNGRLIKTIKPDPKEDRVAWDGTDQRGAQLSSGVYFVVFKAIDLRVSRKILLIR